MTALSVIAIFGSGASGGQSGGAEIEGQSASLREDGPSTATGNLTPALAPAECPPNAKPVPGGCIPRGSAHVVYGERCKSARLATVHYRLLTWQRQRARQGELADRTPIVRSKTCRWSRFAAETWQARARSARRSLERWMRRENQHPKWIALRLLGNDREQWGCLMYIVSVENATMDPTLDFGHGHGNVYEAYGIPQANPGTKMASHGPDWRTNPETQLRWMIDYCRARYGSVCGAAYHRRTRGYY